MEWHESRPGDARDHETQRDEGERVQRADRFGVECCGLRSDVAQIEVAGQHNGDDDAEQQYQVADEEAPCREALGTYGWGPGCLVTEQCNEGDAGRHPSNEEPGPGGRHTDQRRGAGEHGGECVETGRSRVAEQRTRRERLDDQPDEAGEHEQDRTDAVSSQAEHRCAVGVRDHGVDGTVDAHHDQDQHRADGRHGTRCNHELGCGAGRQASDSNGRRCQQRQDGDGDEDSGHRSNSNTGTMIRTT